MQRFEFLLKNEKIKSYRRIATFLILINVASFILLLINSDTQKPRITCFAGVVLLITCLSFDFFFNSLKRNIYQLVALYIAAIVWILMNNWLAALVCIILSLLYQVSIKPLKIRLSNEKVHYISFPSKNLKWNELSNVILKDDILTIDFKNNKILQAEIEDGDTIINEKEFNDFCRQQLKDRSKS